MHNLMFEGTSMHVCCLILDVDYEYAFENSLGETIKLLKGGFCSKKYEFNVEIQRCTMSVQRNILILQRISMTTF